MKTKTATKTVATKTAQKIEQKRWECRWQKEGWALARSFQFRSEALAQEFASKIVGAEIQIVEVTVWRSAKTPGQRLHPRTPKAAQAKKSRTMPLSDADVDLFVRTLAKVLEERAQVGKKVA